MASLKCNMSKYNVAASLLVVILLLQQASNEVLAQTCSTGTGSPTTADANTCVEYVRGLGNTQCCEQTSPSGSCTTMCTSGTVAVDICGNYGACTSCVNAGDALNKILANCPANVNGASLVEGTNSAYGFTFRIRHS